MVRGVARTLLQAWLGKTIRKLTSLDLHMEDAQMDIAQTLPRENSAIPVFHPLLWTLIRPTQKNVPQQLAHL